MTVLDTLAFPAIAARGTADMPGGGSKVLVLDCKCVEAIGVEKLERLIKEEEGASIPEYALLVTLIAVVAMAAIGPFGTVVKARLDEAKTAFGGS